MIFGENQSELINSINNFEPDLIFLTGDIFDERMDFLGTELLIQGIYQTAPTFYVTGNHDYMAFYFEAHIEKLREYNIIVLDNKTSEVELNQSYIAISGISDPRGSFRNPDAISAAEALAKIDVPRRDLKILLSHRPELTDLFSLYDYDLIFTGHAHGGQVIIPYLINGLAAPGQGLFPRFAGGVYDIDGTQLIVSRGLSTLNIPRVFNRPEIVFVTLE